MKTRQQKSQSRHKLRKRLLTFFLSISSCQQKIQTLQQHLITHPFFNPILLFKKLSNNNATLTKKQLITYLHTNIKNIQKNGIQAYLIRHQYERYIDCQQFIEAMIPYNPDVLRECYVTVLMQIRSTQKVMGEFQELYQDMVSKEIQEIMRLAWMVAQIGQNWDYIRHIIHKDILQKCAYIDSRRQIEQIDAIEIRKWMQIWINCEQKHILSIMRWFGGSNEEAVRNGFQVLQKIGQFVDCRHYHEKDVKIRKESNRQVMTSMLSLPINRFNNKQQQFIQRKIDYIAQSRRKDSQHSFAKQFKHTCSLDKKSHVQKSMQLWCKYIFTLLNGQKDLTTLRSQLKSKYHMDQVNDIIRNVVMSKKKDVTSMKNLLKFVSKFGDVEQRDMRDLMDGIDGLAINNQVLLSIFNTNQQKQSPQQHPHHPQILSPSHLYKTISHIILRYSRTKLTLITISKQILQHNLHPTIYNLLNPQNKASITTQNMAQILQEMHIEFQTQVLSDSQSGRQQNEKEKVDNLGILMRHFGDGRDICWGSFQRVFIVQGV